jgi:hypothetical protein
LPGISFQATGNGEQEKPRTGRYDHDKGYVPAIKKGEESGKTL